jgi:hypothetical protein
MSIVMVDFKNHKRMDQLKDAHRNAEADMEKVLGDRAAWAGFFLGVAMTTAIAIGVNRYSHDKTNPQDYKAIAHERLGDQETRLHALSKYNHELVTSGNWAGYKVVDTDKGAFSGVSTVFKVPAVISYNKKDIDVWTGLGGSPSEGLIQAGIAVSMNGAKVWIEMLPHPLKYVSGLSVKSGDKVRVSIDNMNKNGSSTSWKINFVNLSTGKSISESVHYKADVNSAECIVEKPWDASNGKGYTLKGMPDFGTVEFNSCTPKLTGSGVSDLNDTLNGSKNSMGVFLMEIMRGYQLDTTITDIGRGGQFKVNYVNNGHFAPANYQETF